MKLKNWGLRSCLFAAVCGLSLTGLAQDGASVQSSSATVTAGVPGLVNYSSVLKNANGKPLTGVNGVTFLLYKDETGGAPLWVETQNVTADSTGHYSVTLGSTKTDGSLADSFSSGEPRWLGVQIVGQEEQARVLLVAVPYALKAGDAQTIGGLPPSAFVLANSAQAGSTSAHANTAATASTSSSKSSVPANPAVTGKGVVDFIPMWDTTSDIVDSIIFQKSSQIGINTQTPAATLDVSGKSDIRDTLTLFPKSTDNTLAVSGTTFKVDSTGKVTFISGQTFPGTGTITGVTTASGSGLSGGGTTGSLSLKIPSAGVTNAMLANSKITLNASAAGGLTVPGAMTLGNTYTIGLKTCSTNQVLQFNGTTWGCAAVGTGTITGVTAGSGLSGGGNSGNVTLSIPSAGVSNTMLAHDTIGVLAGTDLTGGGTITLGNSATLNLDTTKVPTLAGANTFTGAQTVNNNETVNGLTNLINATTSPSLYVQNTGGGDTIDTFASSGLGIFAVSGGATAGLFQAIGGAGNGSESTSNADASFTAGAAGWEYGLTQENIGVWGYAASTIGIGSYDEAYSSSVEGTICCAGFYDIGMWADTSGNSGTTAGIAALTTVDNGYSIVSYNNSTLPTVWLENDQTSDSTGSILDINGAGFGGFCDFDVSGDLTCTGSITPAVPINNGAKKVSLYGVAAAENWFEDAGSGHLSNGAAVVNLEETFAQTVNTGVEYHVFLTPNGDCKGLYVSQKSANSFEVHELGGGTSNIAFDYRIMAKRRGFETARLVDKSPMLAAKAPRKRMAGVRAPNPDEIRKAQQQKADSKRPSVRSTSTKTVAR